MKQVKNPFRKKRPTFLKKKTSPAVFVVAFALIGTALMFAVRAATSTAHLETEQANLTGCITTVSDASASSGSAVRFEECAESPTVGAVLPITYDLSSLSGTIRYVAPNGSDSNTGTSINSPVATLSRAISLTTSANSTIVIRGGEYRNQHTLSISGSGRNGLKIIAYPGETPVFMGSQAVSSSSGWTTEGSLRYRSYTPRPLQDGGGVSFSNTGSMTNLTGDGVGRYADQAWQGETPLKEVLNKNQVTDGKFFIDRSNNRLYMTATDVSKGSIETSRPGTGAGTDRDRLFQVLSSGVTIEGLKITRYSPNANDYGVIVAESSASNFTLRNVDISHLPYHGVHAGNTDNTTLKNVTLSHVGWQTLGANQTDNYFLDSVKVTNSDYFDEFSSSPASGALKTSRTRNTKVINSEILDNKSHGIWFDQSNINTIVANNKIVGNSGSGMFFEISDGLLLANNYIRSSGSAQPVKLAGSSGLKIINNTIIGGADPIGVYVDSRSSPGCAQSASNCLPNSETLNSDRQGRFTPPSTMDWMPRIDYMANNIIGYPTSTTFCGSANAICFLTSHSSGASAPMNTIIHNADASRGIPKTFMDGNVYANGTGTIIRVSSPSANYSTTSAFSTAMAGSPVSISGIDANSRYGNSWVNTDGSPTAALQAVHNQAIAIPTDATINQYLPAGTRHYGATFIGQ